MPGKERLRAHTWLCASPQHPRAVPHYRQREESVRCRTQGSGLRENPSSGNGCQRSHGKIQKAAAPRALPGAGKMLQLRNISKGMAEDNRLPIRNRPITTAALVLHASTAAQTWDSPARHRGTRAESEQQSQRELRAAPSAAATRGHWRCAAGSALEKGGRKRNKGKSSQLFQPVSPQHGSAPRDGCGRTE